MIQELRVYRVGSKRRDLSTIVDKVVSDRCMMVRFFGILDLADIG